MYVCICKGVTDSQIRDAVNAGAESLRQVRQATGLASCCGQCAGVARDIVRESLEDTGTRVNFYEVA